MRTIAQSIAAIFVALSEATGALPRAKKILAQSLRDGAITDSAARSIIEGCAGILDQKISPRTPKKLACRSSNRTRPKKGF